jgi:hypothetical protein
MEKLYSEGQLGRLREAALAEFGEDLIHEAMRLHRAATGSRVLGLGAEGFAEVHALDNESGHQ